ncbi:MAG: glycosyltransferase family 2 protein [Nitrospinae bacterium]|nr:glycosyltransferase family 2 protein [Nitrospinota bacterium]
MSKNTSIILPVINETESLKKTIEILLNEIRKKIKEIIIIVDKITSKESLSIAESMISRYPEIIKLQWQKRKFLGGALQDAFEHCSGEYCVMMASDLETNPHDVKKLIETAEEGYDIVATSRWIQSNSFEGYSLIKLILNRIFQLFFRTLYRCNLTDLTYGFRIYRTQVFKEIKWEELRHPFLLESILKPIKLKRYKITEIPTTWKARIEGTSQNTFWRNFIYFRTGFKIIFLKNKNLIKPLRH